MAQDKISGAAGNYFGREYAPKIARAIGASMLGKLSNECTYAGKRAVIKCARSHTIQVGVTYKMLGKIDMVIGAFENLDGSYSIISLPIEKYRESMSPTRSRGASAGKVGNVRKNVFIHEGQLIETVRI